MTAGIIIAVTAVIILLLTLAATSTPRDHNPAYTIRHKLATRPRHRISRRDRGEHEFWGPVETGTEGNLSDGWGDRPQPGTEEFDRWFWDEHYGQPGEPGGPAMSPPLRPLPDGYQLGDLRTWNPANVPDPVPTGAQSSAESGTTTDHWDDTTSVDLLPPIRDDLAGCVNVDRYIDRLFSMVDVPRIFQMAGATR